MSEFQSTRPVRGATAYLALDLGLPMFQSTRPVRGATEDTKELKCTAEFQSTRPVRGATCDLTDQEMEDLVSIHAPRAGRDFPRAFL